MKNMKFEKLTDKNIKIIDFVVLIEETTRIGNLLECLIIEPCDFEEYREMWEDYGYDMEDVKNDELYDFGIDKINEFINALSKELKR